MWDENEMKPERIQFGDYSAVYSMSVVLGSFEDVVKLLSFVAWNLNERPGWEVESLNFEDNKLEVRIAPKTVDQPPADEPKLKS